MITEILDVSIQTGRKPSLRREYISIAEMVRQSVRSVQLLTEKHRIVIEGHLEGTVYVDRYRLEQVMLIMLSNAIKYSPHADTIKVSMSQTDTAVKITVTDFGIGIPKAKQKALFNRFYRVDDSAKKFSGWGIGLHLAKKIINRHGGKIGVESDSSRGASFYFTLPKKRL